MSDTAMTEAKALLASRTFWGAVVALGGSAAGLLHYTLSPADAASLVDLLSGAAAGVGGVIAIYGRVKASKKIATVV